MNGVPAIGRITGRIDEIQRSFGLVTRSPAAFRDHLEQATRTEATEEPAPAEASPEVAESAPAAVASTQQYVTLGGTPVPTEAVPIDVVSGAAPPASEWAADLPERAQPYVEMIETVAADTGLDPRLLAGLVWAESTFVPDAVSSAGAIGLAQLMPGTADGLGVDPWDPEANLRGGARYLVDQIERFDSLELGLAAYNAGPGRVIEFEHTAPPYTHAYIDRVLGYYERLGGTR